MANIGYASISVIPSLKGFNTRIRSGIAAPLAAEGKAAGQRFGGLFSSTAAKLIAGVGAATGVVALGRKLVDAAVESQKVGKQTDAVLKSMGQQAGLTSRQIGDLATAISNKTGIDDEAIQSGENLLLTFGNVRNEIGKGNDIFTRATKLAVDMSVALGQDLSSSNIQLGKALNDPVKGITALSRVGVSFTQQQKDQVKALVGTGKTLEAQKLILGEVERQFKGSAQAQATAGERLKVVFGNLQEQLGGYLLPVVEKVAGFLADNLPRAMSATSKAAKPIVGAIKQVVGVLFQGDFKGGGPFAEDSPFVANLFKLREKVQEIIPKVIAVFQKITDWTEENWPKISKVIGQVIDTVKSIISGAVEIIRVVWGNFGNNILELVQRIWPRIQQIIEGALKIIRSVVQVITSLIHGDWSGVWEGIKGIVTGAWEAIQGIVGGALEILRTAIGIALEVLGSIFKGAWGALTGVVSSAWKGITGAVSSGIEGMLGFIRGIPDRILSALGDLSHLLVDAGKQVIKGFLDGLKSMGGKVKDFLGGLTSKLTSWKGPPAVDRRILFENGTLVLQGFIDGLTSKVSGVRSLLGSLTKAMPAAVGPVVYGSVSQAEWDQLLAAGWRGRPNDGMEALYAPPAGTAEGRGDDPAWELSVAPGAERDAMGWILKYVRANPAARTTLKKALAA